MIEDLLLLIPPLVSLYYWWRGEERKGSKILSLFLLSGGLAASLKLLFRMVRESGLDPFAFPSFHTSLASSLFFAAPNPLTLLYAIAVGALRIMGGYHDVLDVIGGFATAGLAWWILRLLEEKIGSEAHRKALHFGIAVVVGYFSIFLSQEIQILLTAALLAGAIAIYLLRWIEVVGRIYGFYSRSGEDVGPITLAGGLFLGAVAGVTPLVGFILGYVDGMASVVGSLKHGVKRGLKTGEGLLGAYLGGVITVILLRGFVDPLMLLTVALLSPLVEFYSQFEDNLILSFFVVGIKTALRVSGLSP